MAPSPPAGDGCTTVHAWQPLVACLWGSAAGTALGVVRCESAGNPAARNPRSTATGLFQILGGPVDPEGNVRLAYSMYRARGWEPWASSRGCWA